MNKTLEYNELEALYNEWIAKLRSGTIEQTKSFLRRDNSYCCLGVLCEIAAEKGIGTFVDKEVTRDNAFEVIAASPTFIAGVYTFPSSSQEPDSSDSILPVAFKNRMYMTYEDMTKLWQMNDREDKSFKQIAEYIEKEIKPKALYRKNRDYGIENPCSAFIISQIVESSINPKEVSLDKY